MIIIFQNGFVPWQDLPQMQLYLLHAKTDPTLITFKLENIHSNNNRMYVMKVVGNDCSSQESWSEWLEKGKQALKAAKIPRMLISGDSDGIFSIESVTQVKDLEVPDNSFHIVKEAGHLPMLMSCEPTHGLCKALLMRSDCQSVLI